jgi:hypothetical protein
MPTGEHLRFQIGRFENGPAILSFCYPKIDDAELLSFGFKYGFKLHYEGSRRLIEAKKNKISYAKSLSS